MSYELPEVAAQIMRRLYAPPDAPPDLKPKASAKELYDALCEDLPDITVDRVRVALCRLEMRGYVECHEVPDYRAQQACWVYSSTAIGAMWGVAEGAKPLPPTPPTPPARRSLTAAERLVYCSRALFELHKMLYALGYITPGVDDSEFRRCVDAVRDGNISDD